MTTTALKAESICVAYRRPDGSTASAVVDADVCLLPGQIVGLAGESGCGKSSLARACLGTVAPGGSVSGRVLVTGVDLLSAPPPVLRGVWGRHVAYVPQNPASSLNPAMRIGRQLTQPLALHLGLRGRQLRDRAAELLQRLGIPDPGAALRRYPHQFSGGQQQRIALALAISCDPRVLILDEPTTGLDLTTQATVMTALDAIIRQAGAAALLVSHDLALLANVADRLLVMYAGEIVESGVASAVVLDPLHPYTRALLAAVPSARERRGIRGLGGRPPEKTVAGACAFAPRCEHAAARCVAGRPALEDLAGGHAVACVRHHELAACPARVPRWTAPPAPQPSNLLEIQDLWCRYRAQPDTALAGISLAIASGDTVAVVGESGSGKSTLLRAIVGLHRPRAGTLRFDGGPLAPLARDRSRATRRDIQLVFQDPDSSLNPRQTVGAILSRPIHMFRTDIRRRSVDRAIAAALEEVGLPIAAARRYPDELSGGERQRVALARAFAARPVTVQVPGSAAPVQWR